MQYPVLQGQQKKTLYPNIVDFGVKKWESHLLEEYPKL